jgi:AcrR family transcriptional regulator
MMHEPMPSRTTKKRDKLHHDILSVAARLICEKGSLGVTLEEISLHADVARKTVYNHFENKEALIKELVMPVCNHAMAYLERFGHELPLSMDHIWNYCIELWEQEDLHAMLLYQVSPEDYPNLGKNKHGFILMFRKLMERIPEFNGRSTEELTQLANAIYMTYMPLLQSLDDREDYKNKFRQAMTGLTLGLLAN